MRADVAVLPSAAALADAAAGRFVAAAGDAIASRGTVHRRALRRLDAA